MWPDSLEIKRYLCACHCCSFNLHAAANLAGLCGNLFTVLSDNVTLLYLTAAASLLYLIVDIQKYLLLGKYTCDCAPSSPA